MQCQYCLYKLEANAPTCARCGAAVPCSSAASGAATSPQVAPPHARRPLVRAALLTALLIGGIATAIWLNSPRSAAPLRLAQPSIGPQPNNSMPEVIDSTIAAGEVAAIDAVASAPPVVPRAAPAAHAGRLRH